MDEGRRSRARPQGLTTWLGAGGHSASTAEPGGEGVTCCEQAKLCIKAGVHVPHRMTCIKHAVLCAACGIGTFKWPQLPWAIILPTAYCLQLQRHWSGAAWWLCVYMRVYCHVPLVPLTFCAAVPGSSCWALWHPWWVAGCRTSRCCAFLLLFSMYPPVVPDRWYHAHVSRSCQVGAQSGLSGVLHTCGRVCSAVTQVGATAGAWGQHATYSGVPSTCCAQACQLVKQSCHPHSLVALMSLSSALGMTCCSA
jgi:hypothetical protein